MNVELVLNRAVRLIVPAAAVAAAALAVFAIVERLALDQRAAERSALYQRSVTLTATALAPGSPLSCLDAGAGETTEAACEAAIFGSPQSTAAAVAYVGARLTLIADAQRFASAEAAGATDGFAAARRALELDRFGITAHVLKVRYGCTPERCAAFSILTDATAIKANMKAWAFDQYVSRHAAAWSAPVPVPAPAAVSQAPAATPAQSVSAGAASEHTASVEPHAGELVAHPLSAKYDFPSAASIPPVSIMNSEPKLPKDVAAAQASEFKADNKAMAQGLQATQGAGGEIPVPPKRPQVPGGQAAPPAQLR
jgi:hypothetical protein